MLKIISALAATSSRLEKEAILKNLKGDEADLFKQIAVATYHPLTNYWVAKYTPYSAFGPSLTLSEAIDSLSALSKREVTGNAAIEYLESLSNKLFEDDSKVLNMIVDRDLRCGASASTFNKIWPGLIPEFELMACHTLNEKTEKKFKFPAIAQLKYDAARVAVFVTDKVEYRTRNGKTYQINNPELDQMFMTAASRIGGDVVFDGEMYQQKIDGTPENRLISNGIATKFIRGTAEAEFHEKIGVAIWDVVPISSFINGIHKEGYVSRFGKVYIALNGFNRVHPAESESVNSAAEAREVAARYKKAGQEGAIIKDPKGIWEAKRSASSLKVKAVRDADLIITGIEAGTGKYAGMMGAINCESADGKVKVSVGTGFSDLQRKQFCTPAIVGRIAAIEYNELVKSINSDTYSLFLPRFIELRDDKDEADTLEKILESKGY